MNKWIAVFCLFFSVKTFSQVNHQTGSAVFSLPVFQWQDDQSKLNAAISINYNSGSGLKVNDIASNIGQGWSLAAGGSIVRVQAGEPDDQKPFSTTGNYDDLSKYPAGLLYNSVAPQNGCPKALGRYPLFEWKNQLYKQHNSVGADREIDRFYYNISGRSGSFIVSKNNGNKGIQLEQNGLKIWYTRNENGASSQSRTTINAFYIQDESGLVYTFGLFDYALDKAKVLQTSYCDRSLNYLYEQPKFKNNKVYHETNREDASIVNPWIVTGWHLVSVKDPLTNRQINFNYNTQQISASAGNGITTYRGNKAFLATYAYYSIISHNKSVTSSPVISSISYPDGHTVNFNYGDNRVDLNGDRKLASIDVQYSGRYLSKYEFSSNYFVLNRITELNQSSDAFQISCARLCLQSIKKYGVDLKADEPPYQFEYNLGSSNVSLSGLDNGAPENVVPPPFSPIKDIWGFYNGNNSLAYSGGSGAYIAVYENINDYNHNELRGLCFVNETHINELNGVVLNAKAVLQNGELKGYAENGLLKKIIYPTGGSISYTYAQNQGVLNAQTVNVGGVHVSSTSVADGGYSNDCTTNPIVTRYAYQNEGTSVSSLWGIEMPVNADQAISHYQPMNQRYKFPWSCGYKYKYPGILAKQQATSISTLQQALLIISEVAGIAGDILSVIDFLSLLTATPAAPVAIILDLIAIIFDFVVGCIADPAKTLTTPIVFNNDKNSVNPLPMQFNRVEVTEGGGGNGKTVLEFTSPTNFNYSLWRGEGQNPSFGMAQRYAPVAYGLPMRTTVYDANNSPIKRTENTYSLATYQRSTQGKFQYTWRDVSCKCLIKKSNSQKIDFWSSPSVYDNPGDMVKDMNSDGDIGADIYEMFMGRMELRTTSEKVFKNGDINQFLETRTDYRYKSSPDANPTRFEIAEISSTTSDNKTQYKSFSYSGDFTAAPLNTLQTNNIMSEPVSTLSYFKDNVTNEQRVLGEDVTEYAQNSNGSITPSRKLELRFQAPPLFVSGSYYQGPGAVGNPAYKETQTFTYNTSGKLIGMKDEGARMVTNIYGYSNKYVTASVVNADATLDKAAYTSFEDGTTGGFSVSGAASVIGTSSLTGAKCLSLPASAVSITAPLNTAKAYTVSYWGTGVLTIAGSSNLITGPSYNGFTYYEATLPSGTTALSITSSTAKLIDEVRLYPKNARMRTVSYDPLIGKTTECDENGRLTYYEYDELGRLRFIKDDAKNVLKMYEYNYMQKKPECSGTFFNKAISQVFKKNNCLANFVGAPYVFSIAANTYSSTRSQEEADLLAENALAANGQTAANTNGTCIQQFTNVQQSASFARDKCSPGSVGNTVTYTVPAGRYTSLISQADADEQAMDEVNAKGPSYANSTGTCTTTTVADWTSTGSAGCELNGTGGYTGNVLVQFQDLNPNSATYNQTTWQTITPANDASCSSVSKTPITYWNKTLTPARVIFTNLADGLNYFDATFSANFQTTVPAGYIPQGTYNVSVQPSGATGYFSFTYQQGVGLPVAITGTDVSNISAGPIYFELNAITFQNTQQSGTYTKNDCPAGFNYVAPSVTYTIGAGIYTSTISQADANAQAQAEITAHGQDYANNNGVCGEPPPPAPCSYTMNTGYTSVAGAISNDGTNASGYLVFTPTSAMTAGNSYLVTTINGGCRPLAPRVINYVNGSQTWQITINPNGQMLWFLVSGSTSVNAGQTIGISNFNYIL